MTLTIIPTDLPTLTPGERKILEKLKTLYREAKQEGILYIQPRIRNMEPDFILIDRKRGVALLEVKDWGIAYINRVDRRKVELNDGKTVDNPLFKTNRYFNMLKGVFNDEDILVKDDGELKVKVYAHVVFTNLTAIEMKENNLHTFFDQYPSKYLVADQLRKLKIDDIFGMDICELNKNELNGIKTLIFPEIKIIQSPHKNESCPLAEEIINALDTEQEKYAKSLPYGHYMVTGIPGSGKTVILLARAIHLLRQNPDWKLKIVTYNNSLCSKLENKLNQLAANLKFTDIHLENIEVSTFHKFAKNIAQTDVPHSASNEWWSETLPKLALEKARPRYDAILIDEYQDFYDDWIRVCIKSCKAHTYKDNRNVERTGINLFLAGDRLQSIYNKRETSWKEIGINMQGRSRLLKKSYRSGSEHIELALQFLKQNNQLSDEVSQFYSPENEFSFENEIQNSVSFLEGSLQEVKEKIEHILMNEKRKPEEILVLCKNWQAARNLKSLFSLRVQGKIEVAKDIKEGKLMITTYHSSKGLEAPITFLVQANQFKKQNLNQNDVIERKLLYVAMTRASEHLYIHGDDFRGNHYAKVIRDLI